MHEQKQIYSFRKLSVGLASVIVGTCFFISTNRQNVKADTVNVGEQQASTVIQQDSSNKQDSNEQNDQTNVSNSKTEQQQSTNERNDVENVESNLNNTDKLDNATKPVEVKSEANQKFDQVKDKFKQETTKADIADSSVIEEKDEGKTIQKADVSAKAEATKKAAAVLFRADSSETALNLKDTKIIDPKTLKENKIEAVVKADSARGIDPVKFASNGGFDPKIWGTMDTSKWQLDSSGNITGYTGDMSHIIIPNSADFAKAGKSYQQIGISSDEMQKLGSNVNSKADTLAISLTDNKKVKATDTDWSNAFIRSTLKQANLEGLDTSKVTNMSYMFKHASSLKNLDVSKWNTGNVTDMSEMFNEASSLTNLDVSKWNTGNVTDMNTMFGSASHLTSLDVSKWNTSKVTDMSYMFNGASSLTSLDVSKWDTGNVTNMCWMFRYASSLTSLDVSNWKTGNVTNMNTMFGSASSLTSLDVSNWDTSKVTNMSYMFNYASSLTSLDVSNWDTSKVTNMSYMFDDANSLTSLDVSNWDTGNVTDMGEMFDGASSLALIVNGDKFADYLVNNDRFAYSKIDSSVKSVTTDNTKLLQLLTNDIGESESATRTIVFTFPTGYSPDLTKYHLTKNGNTYQIKQSADYDKSYIQGTVLINATDDITKHHIDTTKPNEISSTWQPNYDKLVLAHKNADGTVSFDDVQLPKIPGYKTVIRPKVPKVTEAINPSNPRAMLFRVSYIAIPSEPDVTPSKSDVQDHASDRDVQTSVIVVDDAAASQNVDPVDFDWKITEKMGFDNGKRQVVGYKVFNSYYSLNLPYVNNRKLHLVKQYTTKDAVSFAYMGQNTKYVFNIKFVNGHYLLTTYKIKSGKLVKLIDYNFIKSSKMIDVILDWLQLE